MKFVILGAGLSGLSCGAALAKNGHDVVIVEKEQVVGGLARTFRIDGYAFDYGPHYLFGPKIVPLLKETLAPDLELVQVKRAQERMFFKGKYFKFPFEPKNLLFNMAPMEAVCAVAGLLVKRVLAGLFRDDRKDVENWVIQSVGKRIYDYTSLGGYVEKLYGMPPKEISKVWGIQKLKFLARLQNAGLMQLARQALGEKKQLAGQVVHYPHSGIDHLADHIAKNYIGNGGKLLLSSTALGLECHEKGVSVEIHKGSSREFLEADFVVSTIPMNILLGLMKPSPPLEIQQTSTGLRYRATLLLFLRINKEKVMDYQCVYFTEEGFPFRRITEFKNLDMTMAPEGKTSLCVEVTCFSEEEIFSWPEEKLLGVVIASLEKAGYVNRSEVEAFDLLRIPNAYPVYDMTHDSVLQHVLEYLSTFNALISVGRQGLFFYNNMSESILSGYELGQALSQENKKTWKTLTSDIYEQRKEKYSADSSAS